MNQVTKEVCEIILPKASRQYLEVIHVTVCLRGGHTNTGLDNLTRWPEFLALVTLFP